MSSPLGGPVGCFERVEHASGLVVLRSTLLARAGVPHAFSTRRGPLRPGGPGADALRSAGRPASGAPRVPRRRVTDDTAPRAEGELQSAEGELQRAEGELRPRAEGELETASGSDADPGTLRAVERGARSEVASAHGALATGAHGRVERGAPDDVALGAPAGRGGPRGELDLGAPDGRARRILAEIAGAPAAELVGVRQVHGRAVRRVGASAAPELPPAADALVASRPDRLLVVLAADCVPVLVARAGGRAVAAIHAGWRGLVAGVIPSALDALAAEARILPPVTGARPDELVAAVGPCISAARYEVGPEVVEAFRAAELGAAVVVPADGGRPRVCLRTAARIQLERAGVARVDVDGRCTFDEPGELYSHRRDVVRGGALRTGRQGALVAARPG